MPQYKTKPHEIDVWAVPYARLIVGGARHASSAWSVTMPTASTASDKDCWVMFRETQALAVSQVIGGRLGMAGFRTRAYGAYQ
jgi:hypothetical protein